MSFGLPDVVDGVGQPGAKSAHQSGRRFADHLGRLRRLRLPIGRLDGLAGGSLELEAREDLLVVALGGILQEVATVGFVGDVEGVVEAVALVESVAALDPKGVGLAALNVEDGRHEAVDVPDEAGRALARDLHVALLDAGVAESGVEGGGRLVEDLGLAPAGRAVEGHQVALWPLATDCALAGR